MASAGFSGPRTVRRTGEADGVLGALLAVFCCFIQTGGLQGGGGQAGQLQLSAGGGGPLRLWLHASLLPGGPEAWGWRLPLGWETEVGQVTFKASPL